MMTLGSLLSAGQWTLAFNNQATVHTNKVSVWLVLECVHLRSVSSLPCVVQQLTRDSCSSQRQFPISRLRFPSHGGPAMTGTFSSVLCHLNLRSLDITPVLRVVEGTGLAGGRNSRNGGARGSLLEHEHPV